MSVANSSVSFFQSPLIDFIPSPTLNSTPSTSPSEKGFMHSPSDTKTNYSEIYLPDDAPPENIINIDDIDFNADIGELKVNESCSHLAVIKDKGTIICEDCGMEIREDISHEQEWRYFGDQDNSSDPSRCQFRKSPEKGIEKELERLGFSPDICSTANKLYMLVTNGDIKRGELRKGISFVCTFEAHKILKKHKTSEQLQKKFGIDRKAISQGITYYKLRIPREYFQHEEVSAKHYIPEIMQKLNIKQEHIDRVIKLYDKIKDSCPVIHRSNPQSISKAIVFYYLRRVNCNISIIRYSRIVCLSDVILFRLSSEISRILGTANIISLT